MQLFTRFSCLIFFSAILLTGCARDSHDPISTPIGDIEPQTQAVSTTDAIAAPYANNHYLWAYYTISIDPVTLEVEVLPNRQVADHWNILNWIEQAPCTDCLSIADIAANPDGTTNVYVTIKHPFANSGLTGFDVRGITMFDGSFVFPQSGLVMSRRDLNEAELVNADGYTTLYNPTTSGHGFEGYIEGQLATDTAPSLLLNGFKRFMTDNPSNTRNAFFIGDEITVNYKIDMPDPANAWVFGYAVDACWAPATNTPVEDPMIDFPPSANCPEAWKIVVEDIGPGLTMDGGTTMLQIDVYDWQGKDDSHPLLFECPALFDGKVAASFFEDGEGYTRYSLEVDNLMLPPTGKYACLISKESTENDPDGKFWLDLTAYKVYYIKVGWSGSPTDVTPPWPYLYASDACVNNNLAYMACEDDGLKIYDISEPGHPVMVKQVETPQAANLVNLSDGYAIVLAGDLQIIDIDPIETSNIVKTVVMPETVKDIAVSGDYACIIDSQFRIVDINPPETASIVQSISLGPSFFIPVNIAASGVYAYVTLLEDVIDSYTTVIIDFDPPESAEVIKTIIGGGNSGIEVTGGYLYTVSKGWYSGPGIFKVYDVDPPESAHAFGTILLPNGAFSVKVADGFAYVSADDLQVIDVDPPESFHVIDTVPIPYKGGVATLSNGYAYITSGKRGFQIIDVDPLEAAYTVSSTGWPLKFNGLAFSGDIIYATDCYTGLNIVSVNPPDSSQLVSTIYTLDAFGEVEVHGGNAYVASTSGLKIFDIDPPESAYIVNSLDIELDILSVSEGFAYTVKKESGVESTVQIVDIDPPESAYVIGTFNATVEVAGIKASGEYVFLSGYDQDSGGNRFIIVDVSQPESAHIIRTVGTTTAGQIDVSDGFTFIVGGAFLQIIDIEPVTTAYLLKLLHSDPYENYIDVAVSGDYAYVSTDKMHLLVIDIEPPSSAFIVEGTHFCDNTTHIALSGNYVIGDWSFASNGGLKILDIS